MGNEQKVIELQRDTVFTGYNLLILNNVETCPSRKPESVEILDIYSDYHHS